MKFVFEVQKLSILLVFWLSSGMSQCLVRQQQTLNYYYSKKIISQNCAFFVKLLFCGNKRISDSSVLRFLSDISQCLVRHHQILNYYES